METAIALVRDLGFPIFVALFVLCRIEPAMRRLDESIQTLTVVTAKTNGMKNKTIREIYTAVHGSNYKRDMKDYLDIKDE